MNSVMRDSHEQPGSWNQAASSLGLGAAAVMLEDHAKALAPDMLGVEAAALDSVVWQGLPVFVPKGKSQEELVAVAAPGEGIGLEVPALLAGLALTAHAAEYLYFGSDSRFAVAQKVRAFKYLVQAEAMRYASAVIGVKASEYEELLGLSW